MGGVVIFCRQELNKVKDLKLTVEKDPKLFSLMLHNAYSIDNNRECPNFVSCHGNTWCALFKDKQLVYS